MKYPFLTIPSEDDKCSETEITFSDIITDENGNESLQVCIERYNCNHNDFDDLMVTLHGKNDEKNLEASTNLNKGFSIDETAYYMGLISHAKPLFFDFARDGGICHA